MPIEDFTTWSPGETDTGNDIVVNAASVVATDLPRNTNGWHIDDKGAGFYSEDFIQRFKLNKSARTNGAVSSSWGMTNLEGDAKDVENASSDGLFVILSNPAGINRTQIREIDGGTIYSANWDGMALSSDYWLEVQRKESVGTYGTIYLRIYSDEFSTLIVTISIALHSSKKDFQFIAAVGGFNDGNTQTQSFTVSDMNLEVTAGNPWNYYAQQ